VKYYELKSRLPKTQHELVLRNDNFFDAVIKRLMFVSSEL
jgi:hypothetical protein